jgi:aldehyde dehydrogenase (NAD+)
MPSPPVVRSIVSGQPIEGGERRLTHNPARLGEAVAEVALAEPAVFVSACRAARAAQPGWAAVPAPVRGRVIAAVGRLVEANFEALAELVCDEIGKPIVEARGEVQEIVDTCDFFLSEGRRLYGQTVPSEMPSKALFTRRRPVGVVAAVTAGNFPVAVPSWYLVPALLCGNSVVWKPAEYAATSAAALYELFAHAGLPEGTLNLVVADGASTAQGLEEALDEGLIDKIGFTGSSQVGRRIGEIAGRHLQSPCLELGGKNPLVVWSDADLDLAVAGAVFSGFATAGQRCTSLGSVIAHADVHDEFLARFALAVEQAPIGDPRRPHVLYGPLLDPRFAAGFEERLANVSSHHRTLGSPGVGRITSANPRPGFVGDPANGLFYHPTIVSQLRAEDELAQNETFGPIVGVTSVGTFEEAVAFANGPGYGLSAAIYTSTPRVAFEFQDQISAGMVSINNSTCGAEAHLPFGGNGLSGNGSRQSGIWVLDQMTRWQAVNWDWSDQLQRAQMDTAVLPADVDFRLSPRPAQ